MNKDYRESIKEALKTETELLKVFSVFLVALISAVATMLLGDFFNKDTLHKTLLIFGIFGLILVSLFFIIFVFRFFKYLSQLKK